jgi:regulator of replication initiation timing
MSDTDYDIPTLSYWPSVTDLFLTLFIIAIAIVAVVFCALLPTNNVGKDRALVHAVGNDLGRVREPMNQLRAALELDPIGENVHPSDVIAALTETCDTGKSQIEFLKSRIKDLQEQLTRLMGTKEQQAEMDRLLKENGELKRQLETLQQQLTNLLRTVGGDPEAIMKIIRENGDLKREKEDLTKQLHDKPPNIRFSEEKKEYRFESGKSVMGPEFIQGLNENEFSRLASEIVEREEEGRVKVDTLEIIGHTDGAPVGRGGNLDQRLPEILAGTRTDVSSLSPGSNNDLGLLRALAVRFQWELFIESHEHRDILKKIKIRCYSAGQTILPHPDVKQEAAEFRKSDPSARRIEMRLTRLGE